MQKGLAKNRIMDCINVENGIDLVQWPVLPVFDRGRILSVTSEI